jgi:hypothetical protein
MSFLSNIAKSLFRGGLIKKGIKAIGKSLSKGLSRGGVRAIRGIKSGAAQVAALPRAVSSGTSLVSTLPKGFGTGNTLRVLQNSISKDLAKASKTALNKDALGRLSARMAKIATSKKQSSALRNILKNARANETYGQYLRRIGNRASNLVKSLVREGGENLVIDKTATTIAKAAIGLGTVAAGTAIGVEIAGDKKN